MPTAPPIDRKREAQALLANRWAMRARSLVAGKLADALAHAQKALTDAAADAPDGRPTLRIVRRSRSYAAALARLDELWTALVGPSDDSLEGLIRDARAAFLADAMDRWAKELPAEAIRPDPTHTVAERRAIRRMVLHNKTLRKEIGPKIAMAGDNLEAALAQASTRSITDRQSGTILRTWAETSARSIGAAASLAISDSLVAAEAAAVWLVHRPELREGPAPPGAG